MHPAQHIQYWTNNVIISDRYFFKKLKLQFSLVNV